MRVEVFKKNMSDYETARGKISVETIDSTNGHVYYSSNVNPIFLYILCLSVSHFLLCNNQWRMETSNFCMET